MDQVNREELLYHVAVYCRLSKDDEQAGESVSIETQKMILQDYCREKGFYIYQFYVDDGYSGLNFNRPAFTQMLSDIDAGKVNLVLTKDLSRLGRDYIQTGYYTDVYFSRKKVRYIAVNDGIDTNREDNDIAPFKNILNDMYAKDLSRKVKAAKRQRAHKGYFICGQAPYGYRSDPSDRNHLLIDPEAADIVREIYRLALAGNGYAKIAKALEKRKVITPGIYKMQKGDSRFSRYQDGKRTPYQWSGQTVKAILKDQVYTGDMVNHKTEIANYKTKEQTRIPKKEQIIIPDRHEPIIARADYERVQELVRGRHRPRKHDFDNIFRNIAVCGECGSRMSSMMKPTKGGLTPILRCLNHFSHPEECRHYHYIYYDDLYEEVRKRLKRVMEHLDSGELLAQLKMQSAKTSGKKHRKAEKDKIIKRQAALKKIIRKLHEEYAGDYLDAENYHEMLEEYIREQKELGERLAVIEAEQEAVRNDEENVENLRAALEEYRNVEVLSANMLSHLIERIEIGHGKMVDGKKQQDITIVYRFVGAVADGE